jgi:hypothetical protein
MQEGMDVDCCGRCSLGDGILLSLLPHKVDLKMTMGVVAVDSLSTRQLGKRIHLLQIDEPTLQRCHRTFSLYTAMVQEETFVAGDNAATSLVGAFLPLLVFSTVLKPVPGSANLLNCLPQVKGIGL